MNDTRLRHIILFLLMTLFIIPIRAGHTDYLLGGSLIVKEDKTDRLLFDGGYAKAERIGDTTYGYTLFYYNKDHLGNIREVVDAGGNLQQRTNYYPFGAPYADPNMVVNASLQPFKYNGKELDLMHGLNTYDYGARQYDPILARWDRVDPLCEKDPSTTPYHYCHNNPVNRIDSDGMDDYYTSGGQFLCTDNKKTDNIIIRNQALYEMKSMTGAEWLNPDTPIQNADLTAEAYSKIFTNSFKLAGGDCNELADGKIQVTVWQTEGGNNVTYNHTKNSGIEGGALASTASDHTNGAQITAYIFPKGTDERELFSTRSNIASTLKDHEFRGHYENGFTHTPMALLTQHTRCKWNPPFGIKLPHNLKNTTIK